MEAGHRVCTNLHNRSWLSNVPEAIAGYDECGRFVRLKTCNLRNVRHSSDAEVRALDKFIAKAARKVKPVEPRPVAAEIDTKIRQACFLSRIRDAVVCGQFLKLLPRFKVRLAKYSCRVAYVGRLQRKGLSPRSFCKTAAGAPFLFRACCLGRLCTCQGGKG